MTNNPQLWDKLLAAAPQGSALMGGAIVDYLLGIPVNDYDIFYTYIPGHQYILPASWVPTEAKFNDLQWVKEHEEAYLQGIDENGNHPISTVFEYLVDGEHKVQLIGVNYDNPTKHLKNFDHSLTLATYTAKGMFVHKKVFQSKESNTIEYISKNKEIGAVTKSLIRAQKKIKRLGAAYGEHQAWTYKGFHGGIKPQNEWAVFN